MTVASAEPLAEALMGKWYELLRERRPIRKDFLRHIIRPFDFDTMADPSRLVCSTVRPQLAVLRLKKAL